MIRSLFFGTRNLKRTILINRNPLIYLRPKQRPQFIINSIKSSPFLPLLTRPYSTSSGPKKNFLIRLFVGRRKWTFDDFLALFSWIAVGNVFFVLLRTTTFVSFILVIINFLPIQDYAVKSLSEYITLVSGIKTNIESATKQENKIRLKNVNFEVTDENYSNFKIKVDTIDLGLDLLQFLKGSSLVSDVKMEGVRGVIDRRHLDFRGVDPATWLKKREPLRGDFSLVNFEIADCFLQVLDIYGFRPYSILIHQARMKRFRIQWLLYDLLDAESIVGELDGSLFSLSKPKFASGFHSNKLPWSREILKDEQMSLIRVSGLNVDLLNRGDPGPFGWISQGQVDLDIVYMLPSQEKEDDNVELENENAVDDLTIERMHKEISGLKDQMFSDEEREEHKYLKLQLDEIEKREKEKLLTLQKPQDLSIKGMSAESTTNKTVAKDPRIPFFADLRLHHIRATMPPNQQVQTSVPTFLVRPIIAYLNAQPTSPRHRKSSTPPLSCLFTLNLSDFDGSWTLFQARIIDEFSAAMAKSLVDRVTSEYQMFVERGKKNRTNTSSSKKEDLAEEFEEYYANRNENEDTLKSSTGTGLITKVGWFSLQQLSKVLLAHYGGQFNAPRDPEDEQFISVYEEIVKAADKDKEE